MPDFDANHNKPKHSSDDPTSANPETMLNDDDTYSITDDADVDRINDIGDHDVDVFDADWNDDAPSNNSDSPGEPDERHTLNTHEAITLLGQIELRLAMIKNWEKQSAYTFEQIEQQANQLITRQNDVDVQTTRMSARHERLSQMRSAMRHRRIDLDGQLNTLTQRAQTLSVHEYEIDQQQTKLEQRRHDLDRRSETLDHRHEHLNARQQRITEQEQCIESQRQNLDTQRTGLENKYRNVAGQEKQLETARRELETQFEQLSRDKQNLADDRDAIEQEHEKTREWQATLQQDQATLQSQREQIDTEKQQLDNDRTQLNGQQKKHQDDRHNLDNRIQRLDKLETRLNDQQQKQDDESIQLQQQCEQMDRHRQEIEQHQQDLDRSRAEIEKIRQQLDQDRHQLQSDQTTIIHQRETITHQEQTIAQRTQELDEQALATEKLTAELDGQRRHLETQWQDLRKQRHELNTMRRSIADDTNPTPSHTVEIEHEQQKNQSLENELKQRRNELDTKQQELNHLQTELTRYRGKLTARQTQRDEHAAMNVSRTDEFDPAAITASAKPNGDDAMMAAELDDLASELDEQRQTLHIQRQKLENWENELKNRLHVIEQRESEIVDVIDVFPDPDERDLAERRAEVEHRGERVAQQVHRLKQANREINERRARLKHYRRLLHERAQASRDSHQRYKLMNNQANEINQQRETLIEVKQFLTTSEMQMQKRWATTQGGVLAGVAVVVLMLMLSLSLYLGRSLSQPIWQSTSVLQVIGSDAMHDIEQGDAWVQSQHVQMIGEPTVARAIAHMQAQGITIYESVDDATRDLKQHLNVASTIPGRLKLTYQHTDRNRTVAVLSAIGQSFANIQTAAAQEKQQRIQWEIVRGASRSITPIEDRTTSATAMIFVGMLMLGVAGGVGIRFLLQRRGRILDDVNPVNKSIADLGHTIQIGESDQIESPMSIAYIEPESFKQAA